MGALMQLTEMEKLKPDTDVYQVDDGTIFYCEGWLSTKRLYVKWRTKEIVADLPSERMICHGAHGNAIYMVFGQKIYKAVFSPPDWIVVTFIRDILQGESIFSGICTRRKDGKMYVYRICEDPHRTGVLINVSDEHLNKMSSKGMHKDNVLYHLSTSRMIPVVSKLSTNCIVVECYLMFALARDSNRFVYVTCHDKNLYTLDTETLEFLLPLRIEGADRIGDIVGVHNDVITLKVSNCPYDFLMRAQLPAGYVKCINEQRRLVVGSVKGNDELVRVKEREEKVREKIEEDQMQRERREIERIHRERFERNNNQELQKEKRERENLESLERAQRELKLSDHDLIRAISLREEAEREQKRLDEEKEWRRRVEEARAALAVQKKRELEAKEQLMKEQEEQKHAKKHRTGIKEVVQNIVKRKDQQREFESEFLNKFKPRKIIGQGAFGCVFEAQNITDEWKYAVKRIPLRGSDEAVNEALIEVRTLASLSHSGIVGYNSSWIEKPPKGWQKKTDSELLKKLGQGDTLNYKDDCVFIYIQMELCEKSLDDWLYTNKARDLNRAKSWFKQLVSAVSYLHQENKIHRDLKPSNILFDKHDRIKICDLGLVANRAMKNGKEIDKNRTIAGTPMYMAPEQREGHYTSKVDVFSLGLILVELCVVMNEVKAYEVFRNYRNGLPNAVLAHLPDVANLVTSMTNKNAADRPDCKEILKHSFFKKERNEPERDLIERCAICLDSPPTMAFRCGHRACPSCARSISTCHICRKPITDRIRLY